MTEKEIVDAKLNKLRDSVKRLQWQRWFLLAVILVGGWVVLWWK